MATQRDLTDAQLLALAGWITRLYLEAERGHRPLQALRPLVARHLLRRLQHAAPSPSTDRLTATDVRGRQIQRVAADRAYATVVVRDGDRWVGVSLVLRRGEADGWKVTDLTRLQTRHHPQQASVPEVPAADASATLPPPTERPTDATG